MEPLLRDAPVPGTASTGSTAAGLGPERFPEHGAPGLMTRGQGAQGGALRCAGVEEGGQAGELETESFNLPCEFLQIRALRSPFIGSR